MNSSTIERMAGRGVVMVLVLIGLSLTGPSFAKDFTVSVEGDAPYPLWLPQPGASTKTPLPPQAEDAKMRGLAAARYGDWQAAIAGFNEASESAHCAPSLMFNLGLAHQRRGWNIPAAMWYCAYLAALPDAANAAEARTETQKLIAETEADALWLLDEAERLADKLSATPPSSGAKSLRQAALESIATYAYMAGMTDRAEALVRKAGALPGAGKTREIWDKHGLYAAAQSWDIDRTQQIVEQWGADYSKHMRAGWPRYVYSQRGDTIEVRRLMGALDPDDFNNPSDPASTGIIEARDYESMEIILTRGITGAKLFDEEWFGNILVPDIERAFWDGRPDVAQRLARAALAYFGKYDIGNGYSRNRGNSWILTALLGDREAHKTNVRRANTFEIGEMDDSRRGLPIARTALIIAATMPPEEAVRLIDNMISEILSRKGSGDNYTAKHKEIWPALAPLTYFARWAAAGQPDRALEVLDHVNEMANRSSTDPSSKAGYEKDYKSYLEYAFRFAVATGRTDLAFKLADRLPKNSELKLASLNRLALAPGADASVRTRVDNYAASVCAGWRPRDAAQAREVWLRLRLARRFGDDSSYNSLSEYMEEAMKIAQEKPETLPGDIAAHALLLWIGAMTAQDMAEKTPQHEK